jgi:ABC-2 type transport system ATP-binding protein
MPDGQVLEFSGLTKRFGAIEAVSGFTARVEPGVVTGFLGPNGAGKTTTLRMLLGLVRSDAGTATIGGVAYAKLSDPLRTVGAVLEASSFHPGRSAANHLKIYAQAAGLPLDAVDRTLATVGLSEAAGRKVGGFSLGMRQRLGLAYALLGDPAVLVLDEPANGLDPEGIKWLRGLLRDLARDGRTVLVSSHLLAEVQQTVDALLIIARGRLVFQGALDELTDPSEYATVVDSPDRAALVAALRDAEVPFEVLRSGLTVRGMDPAAVGVIAAASGVPLSGLQRRGPALEEVFLDLVNGVRVHRTAPAGPAALDAVAEQSDPVAEPDTVSEPVPDPESVPEPVPDPEPVAEPVEASDLTAADDPSTSSGTHDPDPDVVAGPVDASDPAAEEPHPTTAAFAVASTGIIDIVPSELVESDAAPDATAAPEPEPAAQSESEHHQTFAVASTGLIDIVPSAPLDADPDVEAVGDIDEALSAPDPEAGPIDPERPWETYVKTDADTDADRFFSGFDEGDEASGDRPARHDGEGESR